MSIQEPAARAGIGHEARLRVPPEAHAQLSTGDRPGPVRVLGEQARTRVPELVPIRHTRMAASAFSFFRGAAAVMAGDLAGRPVSEILRAYAASLGPGRAELVRSHTVEDVARKVVGVGSVGTRCWIALMRGRDEHDPLFLQVKEAQESVLAPHLGPSPYYTEGERVVAGQRIMQAASDVFLGWHRTTGLDGMTRDYFVRQLHDWKCSATIETMAPKDLRLYAGLCAWTLARAHALSGDRIAIAAYLGDDDRVPHALADFAHSYAEVNEQDHAVFSAAVAAGELAGTAIGTT